ncbi:MAG: hypothetical protein JWN80_2268 [Microbacteriaceae bacterium]|nr:hypothetical protein [Microbacteriaceae bacterium]
MTETPVRARAGASFIFPVSISIVVIVAVTGFGLVVARSTAYTIWDGQLLTQLAAVRVAPLVDLSLLVDRIFSPLFAAAIGLGSAALVFIVTRRWSTVLHFALLVALPWLGSEVIKVIVHRPRPDARLADTLVPNPDPYSYPSGHVCFAVGLGFAVFVLVARSRVRVIVAVLAVLLSLVTAVSRAYLGVHYPTDVVASLLYAAAAFTVVEALWRRFGDRARRNGYAL